MLTQQLVQTLKTFSAANPLSLLKLRVKLLLGVLPAELLCCSNPKTMKMLCMLRILC